MYVLVPCFSLAARALVSAHASVHAFCVSRCPWILRFVSLRVPLSLRTPLFMDSAFHSVGGFCAVSPLSLSPPSRLPVGSFNIYFTIFFRLMLFWLKPELK